MADNCLKRPIHVLGAGGIGVALGWSLARAGCEVLMVEALLEKVAAGRSAGIEVVGRPAAQIEIIRFEHWEPSDEVVTLLCTKTYDNAAVLARLGDGMRLVPVQNGFDPELDRWGHAGEGIASFVSECERDRPVTRITRAGSLHLGPRRGMTGEERADLMELAEVLEAGELFRVEWVEDIRPYKATKLMYNAAVSPLAAAAGVDNGELLRDRLARRLFFALLRENYGILKHARIPLARIGPFHPDTVSRILGTPGLPELMGHFFRPSLRGTYCSMAPDMAGEQTEVQAYNGHLIRLAGDFPCPLNRAVLSVVETIIRERLRPARERLLAVEALWRGGGGG
ncbi:MAG: ketopantoate reductase family protein [Verrucomicrobiae bacterium]|nr:ketopantoate reductase family protein [Verrucomicrobiae bacterium]